MEKNKKIIKSILISLSIVALFLFSGCNNTYKYNSFGEIKELNKNKIYQLNCYYYDTYDNIKSQISPMCNVNIEEVTLEEFENCNIKNNYNDKYICKNLNGTTDEIQKYYKGVWN